MSNRPEKHDYLYEYQGYEPGVQGAVPGTVVSGHGPVHYTRTPQNQQGYPQPITHAHEAYYDHATFSTSGISGHITGYNQPSYSQNFNGTGRPFSVSSGQQTSQINSIYSQSDPASSPERVFNTGTGSQPSHIRPRPAGNRSSGLQQGRQTYRHRRAHTNGDSDDDGSDCAEENPTASLSSNGTGNLDNLSTHARRKMYVAGLEGYLSKSRETLLQNGREVPRVERVTTARGLKTSTKTDMLSQMERTNVHLREVARSKESSSPYHTKADGH